MKRAITAVLMVMLLFFLTACGSSQMRACKKSCETEYNDCNAGKTICNYHLSSCYDECDAGKLSPDQYCDDRCLQNLSQSPLFGSSVNFCMKLTDTSLNVCTVQYRSRSDCIIELAKKTNDAKVCDKLLTFNPTTYSEAGCGAGKGYSTITISPNEQYTNCIGGLQK